MESDGGRGLDVEQWRSDRDAATGESSDSAEDSTSEGSDTVSKVAEVSELQRLNPLTDSEEEEGVAERLQESPDLGQEASRVRRSGRKRKLPARLRE